jgi:hypothetical protein
MNLFSSTEIEPNPKLSPLLSSILGYETVQVFMGWDPKQPLRGVDFIIKKKKVRVKFKRGSGARLLTVKYKGPMTDSRAM